MVEFSPVEMREHTALPHAGLVTLNISVCEHQGRRSPQR